MATLRSSADGSTLQLAPITRVGRNPDCLVQIAHERVSRLHAIIRWTDGQWVLVDHTSHNGTFFDRQRLTPMVEHLLRPGQVLGFGQGGAASWLVVDVEPPGAFAVCEATRQQVVADRGLLFLPSADAPEATLWQAPNGLWRLERDGKEGVVHDLDLLTLGGEPWRVYLPGGDVTVGTGVAPVLLQGLVLHLRRSKDREHVTLCVDVDGQRHDLGERQHWGVLWALAAERRSDHKLAEHDQGWLDLDQLAQDCRVPERHLDTYISRARQELHRLGVDQAARIVEARPRQRRIGVRIQQLVMEG